MAGPLEVLQGRSPRIEAIRRQVTRLLARQKGGRRPPPVLILGETGTGKGLLAQAIHQAGPRRAGPFVDINCAAIPETLLEAELFGYERGAFTDARSAKAGLVQTAHGGTVFFDEIGLLPTALQGKLLTVLEDHTVRRLGSTQAERVDVAIVAATSVDLRRAVSDGRFREDLYHRLAVITLELPPLRMRGPDILVLADHFLARACADYGLAPRALTPDARAVLAAHRWPGNVRELANAMESLALLSEGDEISETMLDFTDAGRDRRCGRRYGRRRIPGGHPARPHRSSPPRRRGQHPPHRRRSRYLAQHPARPDGQVRPSASRPGPATGTATRPGVDPDGGAVGPTAVAPSPSGLSACQGSDVAAR